MLASMAPAPFAWEVRNVGVKVAALMTPEIIRRRIGPLGEISRVLLPGRCKGDLDALSRALGVPVQLGPEELKDLAEFFGGKARAHDLRAHDCRIFAEIVEAPALPIGQILERARGLARRRRRRDRSGLPAGDALSAARGGGPGAQGAGPCGQHRFGRPGRAAPRRSGRCRLSAEPQRAYAGARVRDRCRAGADPRPARRAGRPGRRLRAAGGGRPCLSRRPDPRPDPFRLHRLDRPLPRAAPPAAGGRAADGRRQSHRADRRRYARDHHDPDGHGLRAGDPQRAGRAGEPALPAGCRRGRAGAADPLCRQGRPQPAAGLRRGPAVLARPAAVREQPGRDRGQCRRDRRPEFPDRGRGRRHPRLQPRRPSSGRRPVRPVPQARGRAGRRPRLLSGGRAGPGADRPPARQALCPGQRAALGLRRAATRHRPAALRPGRAARWRHGARRAARKEP